MNARSDDGSKDLAFMRDPEQWPRWPQLPVKRYVDGQMQAGVMIEETIGVMPLVILKNVWAEMSLDHEVIVYHDLEAIVADGWRVD